METPIAPTQDDGKVKPRRSRETRRATILGTIGAIVAVYLGSLLGYAWLSGPLRPPLPDVDSGESSVVMLHITSIQPVDSSMRMRVLLLPDDRLVDARTGTLNTDINLRFLTPFGSSGLTYERGRFADAIDTTLTVLGDPDDWPLDEYTTGLVQVELLTGSVAADDGGPDDSAGDPFQPVPVRVEIAHTMAGWEVRSDGAVDEDSVEPSASTSITLSRNKASLVFDLGVCLVLLAMPATALFVAVETFRGRRKFLPPLTTWFAAMLFAIVPLRNILPGAPTAGAWVDQVLVLWVLLSVAGAMVVYIAAWWRQSD